MQLSSRSPTGQQGSSTFQWTGPSSVDEYYKPAAPEVPPAIVTPAPAIPATPAPALSSSPAPKSGEGQTLFSSSAPAKTAPIVETPSTAPRTVEDLKAQEKSVKMKGYVENAVLDPFNKGLTGFVTDYTPVGPGLLNRAKRIETRDSFFRANPELGTAIQGDGILGSWWKDSLKSMAGLGLDVVEIEAFKAPFLDYGAVKKLTNAARLKMGRPIDEPTTRSEAISTAMGEVTDGVGYFFKQFKDSGVKLWKASHITDPIKRRDAYGQLAQDTIDGWGDAFTMSAWTKYERENGFSTDDNFLYWKGVKIGDLTEGEKEIAGVGKVAGSLVGSMSLWKTLSPFAGRSVLKAFPKLTGLAVKHPFIFQVTAANFAEEGLQFAVSKVLDLPYNFSNTVTSVLMQFGFESFSLGKSALGKGGYDPLGLRAEQAAKFQALPEWAKGIDYDRARALLDNATEHFIVANKRTPTQLELQDILGDTPVPMREKAQPMTWNDLHQATAKEWMKRANTEGEQRLLGKTAGREGRPGIDFPAEPPRAEISSQTKLLAEYYGVRPDQLVSDIREAGLGKENTGGDQITKFLSERYKKDAAGFAQFVDGKMGEKATAADYNAVENARIDATKNVPIGEDAVPISTFEPQGLADAARFKDLMEKGMSVDDAWKEIRAEEKMRATADPRNRPQERTSRNPWNEGVQSGEVKLPDSPDVRALSERAGTQSLNAFSRKLTADDLDVIYDATIDGKSIKTNNPLWGEQSPEVTYTLRRDEKGWLATPHQQIKVDYGVNLRTGPDAPVRIDIEDLVYKHMTRQVVFTEPFDPVVDFYGISQTKKFNEGAGLLPSQVGEQRLPGKEGDQGIRPDPNDKLRQLQEARRIEDSVMPFDSDVEAKRSQALELRRTALPEIFERAQKLPAEMFKDVERGDGIYPFTDEALKAMGPLGKRYGAVQKKILAAEKAVSAAIPGNRVAITGTMIEGNIRKGMTRPQAKRAADKMSNLSLARAISSSSGDSFPELQGLLKNYEVLRSLHEEVAATARAAQRSVAQSGGGAGGSEVAGLSSRKAIPATSEGVVPEAARSVEEAKQYKSIQSILEAVPTAKVEMTGMWKDDLNVMFDEGGSLHFQDSPDAVTIRAVSNGGKQSGIPTKAVRTLMQYAADNGKSIKVTGIHNFSYWKHLGFPPTEDFRTALTNSELRSMSNLSSKKAQPSPSKPPPVVVKAKDAVVEPPKAEVAHEAIPANISSRKKAVSEKQPIPIEAVQPARTSRLRERLETPAEAKITEPSNAKIVQFLQEQFTAPIRTGKATPGSLGTFFGKKNVVRLANALDVPTAAHEIGHYIDNEFAFNKSVKAGNRYLEPYRSELLRMGEFTSKKSYSTGKKIKEGIAEFVRRYVEEPKTLDEMAPNFKKYFTQALPPEGIKLLDTVREAHGKLTAESPEYRVKSQISTEAPVRPLGERIKKAINVVFSAVDDELGAFRQFTETAEGKLGTEVLYKNDPYVIARNTRGLDGKILQWILPNMKPFDSQGRPLEGVRSLGSILKDVPSHSDFDAYLVSKRAIDLHSKDFKTGISQADAESVVSIMETRHPEFVGLQREIVGWSRALMQYAQDKGFLSAEQVKKMTENGDNYVPFYRVVDDVVGVGNGSGKKFADINSPFKRMKGSTRQIISPLESLTKNAYVIMSAVDRNRVGQAVVRLARQHPDLGALIEEIPASSRPIQVNVEQLLKKLGIEDAAAAADEAVTLFVHGNKPNVAGENVMMVVENGKPTYHSVDPLLYKAIMNMNEGMAHILIRAMAKPAGFLRAGATLTPEFIGRNPIRDQVTAYMYSKGGYIPGLDFARGLIDTIKKGEDYQRAAIGGAMQANFTALDRPSLKKVVDGMFRSRREKIQTFFTHPVDSLRLLSEFGELGTRVGEARKVFSQEMARSGDYEEAITKSAFAARNVTLDFARRGSVGKSINMMAAFWNAGVQDLTKFARELSGREKGSSPGRTAIKALASITAPSIAAYLTSKDDKRYQKLPRWQKDYFWIFALPGVPLIRIPKPFLPGLIFGSLPVRLMEAHDTGSLKPIRDFFISLKETSLSQFTPSGITPTAAKPIIEYITGYSEFFGRQTVPQDEASLLPEDQYGIYTSETYKAIGKALGKSPRKIEALVYGYTAGLGRYVTDITDFLGSKAGVLPPKPPEPADVTQYPFIRAFTISDLTNVGQSVSDFYDEYTKAEQTYASLKNAADNQDVARAKELRDNNIQDLIYIAPDGSPQLLHNALGAVADTLSDLRKEREKVLISETMSPLQKSEKIMAINGAMQLVTENALKMTGNRLKSVDDFRTLSK